jgi:MoaA/NifB/PqqE/SkfB family radical SAM enzyme
VSGIVNRFESWWEALRSPDFDWIQIEVTTHCNSGCRYCPHTVLADRWQSQHLPLTVFSKILPAMANTALVYLQGWGEPLMNPDFFEFVRLAKSRGSRVGTSSNGTLVDAETVNRMIDHNLDILTLSLAGTGPGNDTNRQGAPLSRVLAALKLIADCRNRLGSEHPELHIAYLLLKSNRGELRHLPDLLRDCSVSEVVISTLDFIPAPELASEAILPKSEVEFEGLRADLNQTASALAQSGIGCRYYLAHPVHQRQHCTENVQRSLFVTAAGEVAPCVFCGLPVNSDTDDDNGEGSSHSRLTFGSTGNASLRQIWECREYVDFRRSFATGLLHENCRYCPKLRLVTDQVSAADRGKG